MIRFAAPHVLALALLTAACASSPSADNTPSGGAASNRGQSARCDMSDDLRAVNDRITAAQRAADRAVERAREGDASVATAAFNASITDNADALLALAQAAGAEDGPDDTDREAICRETSIRAYSALLRVPGREDTALAGIARQAELGELVCAARTDNRSEGANTACEYIRFWSRSALGMTALYELREIRTGVLNGAAAPAQTVPEEIWSQISSQTLQVQNTIANSWSDVPANASNKVRMACDFHNLMVIMADWPAPPQSPGKIEGVMDRLRPTMMAAVAALPADEDDPADASVRERQLAGVCLRIGGT